MNNSLTLFPPLTSCLSGEELLEGNMNEGGWSIINSSKEEEAAPLQRQKSFAWRGGQQRQTTGIWMWSEPFIRATDSSNGEKIAILLMDTQGMFDNETTMTLTAQIFGLSTLVSSFQVIALLLYLLLFLITRKFFFRSTMWISEFKRITCSIWPCSLSMVVWPFSHR